MKRESKVDGGDENMENEKGSSMPDLEITLPNGTKIYWELTFVISGTKSRMNRFKGIFDAFNEMEHRKFKKYEHLRVSGELYVLTVDTMGYISQFVPCLIFSSWCIFEFVFLEMD